MGIMQNTIDKTIYVTLKAYKETINGLMHGTACVSSPIDLTFINDMIVLIEIRLTDIKDLTVLDGYLSLGDVRVLNKEVDKLEKHLLSLKNIASITEL